VLRVTRGRRRREGARSQSAACDQAVGQLLQVLEVRPVQPAGALVRIQAEGRLQVLALQQQQPFLKATVSPLYDLPLGHGGGEAGQQEAEVAEERQRQQLAEAVEALKEVMRDVQNLALKFKSRETANLQSAMYWAEAAPVLAGTQGCPVEELACRLSFAALQSLPRSSQAVSHAGPAWCWPRTALQQACCCCCCRPGARSWGGRRPSVQRRPRVGD
jgi:hypothetical protein